MRVWRAIPDRPNYEVSDDGLVRSLGMIAPHRWPGAIRRIRGRMLRQTPDKDGYLQVTLGAGVTRKVHRLVCEAFHGPSQGRQVNHLNGIKSDNRIDNLEWCSNLENRRHAIRYLGLNRPRLSNVEVMEIRECRRLGATVAALAYGYGVSPATIAKAIRGVYAYRHLPQNTSVG